MSCFKKIILNNSIFIYTDLIFVQLAVFKLGLSLFTECDDDETYKDVHHEEGNDDNVDDEKD